MTEHTNTGAIEMAPNDEMNKRIRAAARGTDHPETSETMNDRIRAAAGRPAEPADTNGDTEK